MFAKISYYFLWKQNFSLRVSPYPCYSSKTSLIPPNDYKIQLHLSMYSLAFLSLLYCTVLSSLGFFSLRLSPLLLFFSLWLSPLSFFLWLFPLLLFSLYGLLLSFLLYGLLFKREALLSCLSLLYGSLFTREAPPLSSLAFLFSIAYHLQGKLHLSPLLPFSSP